MICKGNILVVDDEPRNIKLLAAYLREEGFEPLTACNGEEALKVAAEKLPDVILLDIMMPGLDGFEVTQRLKADPDTQHIPVVLVTSLDGSDNRVRGLNAGADEFLSKPINKTELLARVRALHRMKQLQDELDHRNHITSRIIDQEKKQKTDGAVILFVDDDPFMRKQVDTLLVSNNYVSIAAGTAAEAKDILLSTVPDLILLDLGLPDKDGMTLMKELKAIDRLSCSAFIILTGTSDLDRKVEGIDQGADDYVIKPVENNELLARIRAILRRKAVQQSLLDDVEQLQIKSITDRLTGVRNRQYMDTDLYHRFDLAIRSQKQIFSICMVDVDYFKQINDEFGHLTGDTVLRHIAKQLEQSVRTSDIVTRYGGEEFCVIMPDTDLESAAKTAERMRASIEQHNFKNIIERCITCSFGVASYTTEDDDVSALITRADTALYEAKGSGRNKVCLARPVVEIPKQG